MAAKSEKATTIRKVCLRGGPTDPTNNWSEYSFSLETLVSSISLAVGFILYPSKAPRPPDPDTAWTEKNAHDRFHTPVDQAELDRYYARAYAQIYNYLRETLDPTVQGILNGVVSGDGRQAFLQLYAAYEPHTGHQISALMTKLVTMDGQGLAVHGLVDAIRKTHDQLHDAIKDSGRTLGEVLQTHALVRAHLKDPDYELAIAIMLAKENCTFDQAVGILARHESEYGLPKTKSAATGAAFHSTTSAPRPPKLDRSRDRAATSSCTACPNSKGHTTEQCFKLHPELKPAWMQLRDKEQAKRSPRRANVTTVESADEYDEDEEEDEEERPERQRSQKSAGGQAKRPPTGTKQTPRQAWVLTKGQAYLAGSKQSAERTEELVFILDGGTSGTTVPSLKGVINFNPSDRVEYFAANGEGTLSGGSAELPGKIPRLDLVPEFPALMAEMDLYDRDFTILKSKKDGILVIDPDGRVVLEGFVQDGLFMVKLSIDAALQGQQMPTTFPQEHSSAPSARPVASSHLGARQQPTAAPDPKTLSSPTSPAPTPDLHSMDIPSPTRDALGLLPSHKDEIVRHYLRLGCVSDVAFFHTVQQAAYKGNADHPCKRYTLAQITHAIDQCPAVRDINLSCRSVSRSHRDLKRADRTQRHVQRPFQSLSADLMFGPSQLKGRNGETNFLTIHDRATGITDLIPQCSKADTVQSLNDYFFDHEFHIKPTDITLPYGANPKLKSRLHTDQGGEFKSHQMDELIRRHRMRKTYSDAKDHEGNGTSEIANRVLKDTARCLHKISKSDPRDFPDSFKTSSYLTKRTASSANPAHRSPYDMLYGRPADLGHLRILGSRAYVHIGNPKRAGTRCEEGKLIGYTRDDKYIIRLDDNRVVETRNCSFLEPLFNGNEAGILVPHEDLPESDSALSDSSADTDEQPSSDHDTETDSDDSDPTSDHLLVDESSDSLTLGEVVQAVESGSSLIERAVKSRTVPRRPNVKYANHAAISAPNSTSTRPPQRAFFAHRASPATPVPTHHGPLLQASIAACHEKLLANDCEIVDDNNFYKLGWTAVHKYKPATGTEPERYKTRLAPWGHRQRPNTDFDPDKVSYPSLTLESNDLLSVLSVSLNRSKGGMYEQQVDVISAFSTELLDRDQYAHFPPGMSRIPGKCLRIKSAMEGLKQSGYIFWHALRTYLVGTMAFTQNQYEPCIFYKRIDAQLVIIGMCTDDFRVLAESLQHLNDTVAMIQRRWQTRLMAGDIFMGVKYERDRAAGTISKSMEEYIDNVLADFNMTDCNPCKTPCAPGTKLICPPIDVEIDPVVASFPLDRLIGEVMWIQRNVMPELAYAINQISSHLMRPTVQVITAAKRVLRYIKGRKSHRMVIRATTTPLCIDTYADSDYNGEPQQNGEALDGKGRRSVSAAVIMIRGSTVISVSSSFQKKSSRSTFEAEYICLDAAIQKAISLRNVLSDMGLAPVAPLRLYEDNQSCIASLHSEAVSNRARHIETAHCLLRQLQSGGEIDVVYLESKYMLANFQNKGVTQDEHVGSTDAMYGET